MAAQHIHDHDHSHSHHDHHTHTHSSLAHLNANHFDQHIAGPTNHDSFFTPMYAAIESELLARRSWFGLDRAPVKSGGSGPPIRLLDYACGGGHGTKTLLPYMDQAIGMDVSGKSVEAYNAWAKEQGLGEGEMVGIRGNFMEDEEGGEGVGRVGGEFDLIIVVMALHHVGDPELLVRKLAGKLRVGSGRLVVIDWGVEGCQLPEIKKMWEGKGERAGERGAVRKGFSREEMQGWFEGQGGCEEVEYEVFEGYKEAGEVFIAKGRRRADV